MIIHTITASGRKALEKKELGTQATLVLTQLARKDGQSTAAIAAAIEGKLETRQPAARVAGFYLNQFKTDGLSKATKTESDAKPAKKAVAKKAAKPAKKKAVKKAKPAPAETSTEEAATE